MPSIPTDCAFPLLRASQDLCIDHFGHSPWGVWTLEQPSGSVLEYYPTFRWIMANIFTCGGNHAVSCLFRFRIIEIKLDRINIWSVESSGKKPTFSVRALIILTSEFSMFEVVKVQWWMQHYSAPTPKRHYGKSNSAATLALDRGALKKDQRKPKEKRIRTAVVYFDKKGVKRYKGTDALRSTENLDIYISNFHLVFPFCEWNSKIRNICNSNIVLIELSPIAISKPRIYPWPFARALIDMVEEMKRIWVP